MDTAISRVDISQTLSKIREISEQTRVFGGNKIAESQPAPFEAVLSLAKNAVMDVDKMQHNSQMLQNAYLSGDTGIAVSDVMLATMKSRVAFEGLLVVRNKLLEAYKEIMNMPV